MTEQPDLNGVYERMKRVWIGEGKPGTISFGGQQYSVATPNGEDQPVFTKSSMEAAYSSLSTSGLNPGKKTKVSISPDKAADVK